MVWCAEYDVQRLLRKHRWHFGYHLLQCSFSLVANASFFRAVLDIHTQILSNVFALHLGYCTLRYTGFLVKTCFQRRLGHCALPFFDRGVEVQHFRWHKQRGFRIVLWRYDMKALHTDWIARLRIRCGNFALHAFYGHTYWWEDRHETTVCCSCTVVLDVCALSDV